MLIVADTNELQVDWVDGGRLDNLLDGAASAGDPWTTALPGAYGAGTAGEIIGDLKNGGRLDLIFDTIAADVVNLDGAAMRGTDGANTTVPDVAGAAATLHGITDGKIDIAQADLDTLTGIDGVELSTAAINALWAKAMSDLAAGAPSATASALTALNYLYEAWRNRTITNGDDDEISLYKDDNVTKLCKLDMSHVGEVFIKGKYGAAD